MGHFSMPSIATAVNVIVGARGELKQLSYVTQAEHDSLDNIRYMDKELISSPFTRCDSGDDTWFRVGGGDSLDVERKRLVRFYRSADQNTLAMLGVDQSCGANSVVCKQATLIVFTTYPWWMLNSSSLIEKTCGSST